MTTPKSDARFAYKTGNVTTDCYLTEAAVADAMRAHACQVVIELLMGLGHTHPEACEILHRDKRTAKAKDILDNAKVKFGGIAVIKSTPDGGASVSFVPL